MNRSKDDEEAFKTMKALAQNIRARREIRLDLQTSADDLREQMFENNKRLGELEIEYFNLAESLIIIDVPDEEEEE